MKHQTCWTSRVSSFFSFPWHYFQDETDSDRRRFSGSSVSRSVAPSVRRLRFSSSNNHNYHHRISSARKTRRIQTGGGSSVQRFIRQSLRRSIGPSVHRLRISTPNPLYVSHHRISSARKTRRIQTGGGSSVQRFIRQSPRRSVNRISSPSLQTTSTNSVCAKKKPRPTTPTTPTKTTTTTKSAVIHQPSSIFRDPSSVSRRPSTVSCPPFYVLRMKRAWTWSSHRRICRASTRQNAKGKMTRQAWSTEYPNFCLMIVKQSTLKQIWP